MAKDLVEIHDPVPDHNNLTTNTDCDHESTSDTDGMEDTVEFRLLMAYAKRRRPRKESEASEKDLTAETLPPSPQAPAKTGEEVKEEKTEKEKKKRRTSKTGKRLLKIFSCVRPKTKDNEVFETPALKPDPDNRCGDFIAPVVVGPEDVPEEKKLDEVAGRLTEIADDVPFVRPELESDSEDCPHDVEKVIGLLLRDAGDRLNDEELNGAAIVKELFWNYSFFEKIIQALLRKMGLAHSDNLGPQASPKTQIAVTCEAASRLSALDTQPMNRMLAYGAKYLEKHHSSWAKQQGGYEEAFHSDDEDDDDVQ